MEYEPSKEQSNRERHKTGKIRSLGLCLGASTISITQVEQEQGAAGGNPGITENSPKVVGYSLHPHEGDPKQTLLSALEGLFDLNTRTRSSGIRLPVCQTF